MGAKTSNHNHNLDSISSTKRSALGPSLTLLFLICWIINDSFPTHSLLLSLVSLSSLTTLTTHNIVSLTHLCMHFAFYRAGLGHHPADDETWLLGWPPLLPAIHKIKNSSLIFYKPYQLPSPQCKRPFHFWDKKAAQWCSLAWVINYTYVLL